MSADREQNHLDAMTDMVDSPYSGWGEPQEPEEPLDMLQLALSNTYQAYMRGLYREAFRKNSELLLKAVRK
jgi:hypothetical protein